LHKSARPLCLTLMLLSNIWSAARLSVRFSLAAATTVWLVVVMHAFQTGIHGREPDCGRLIVLHYCDRSEKRMSTITVSSKFQIVIPLRIREALGIKPGEKLHAIEYRGRIELVPVRPTKAARGSLKGLDTNVPRDTDRA
jgi:AbrB family looped-hinge helix DNA binding protein